MFCVFVTAPHFLWGLFYLQIAGHAGNDVIPGMIGDPYDKNDKNLQYELSLYIRISI